MVINKPDCFFTQAMEQRNTPCPSTLLLPKMVEILKELKATFSEDVGLSDDDLLRDEKLMDLCNTYAAQIADEIRLVRRFILE